MEFPRVDRKQWATSDGSLGATMISLFESGNFSDCTIQVGSEGIDDGVKKYKCHRMILAVASVVFETMLYGAFKEAKGGPDEPILLDDVSSESFVCAMRFVYGREAKFKKTSLAVQVFRFAHKMQIDPLLKEVEKFLLQRLSAAVAFAAYDLFKFFDIKAGLSECKNKILKHQTEAALASGDWLNMQLDSVLDFLQMDFMDVSEPDLVRALVKWGRAQVQRDGHDPEDGQRLRSKMLPCLKFINFHVLSHMEFTLLCLEDLGRVMSYEEKFLVMMCITLEKWKMVPEEISLAKYPPRLRTFSVVELRYRSPDAENTTHYDSFFHKLTLEVNRSASLIGFQLETPQNSPVIESALRSYKVALTVVGESALVGTGSSDEKVTYQGKKYIKVKSVGPMVAGLVYLLKIEFPSSVQYSGIPFTLESPSSYKCNANQLTLSVHNQGSCNWFAGKISTLLFDHT